MVQKRGYHKAPGPGSPIYIRYIHVHIYTFYITYGVFWVRLQCEVIGPCAPPNHLTLHMCLIYVYIYIYIHTYWHMYIYVYTFPDVSFAYEGFC